MAFDLGAPILDVRQNPPLQSQPREHEQAQHGQAGIHHGFPGQLKPAPPRHEAQPPDDWIEKCAQLQSHEKFGTGWQRPRPQCRWARRAPIRAAGGHCCPCLPGTSRNTRRRGAAPAVNAPEPSLPLARGKALAAHSRFVQRVRRRYADMLHRLPAGLPDFATITALIAALEADGAARDERAAHRAPAGARAAGGAGHRAARRPGRGHRGHDAPGRGHARARARAGAGRHRPALGRAAQRGRREGGVLDHRHGQARRARAERVVRHRPDLRLRGRRRHRRRDSR